MRTELFVVLLFTWLKALRGSTRFTHDPETFLYFAYGSNLLEERIHINSPSAVYYANGNLSNYQLDFATHFELWNGTIATIVPLPGRAVTGVLYTLDIKDMANLDKQEGVDIGLYKPLNVTVKVLNKPHPKVVKARTYILVNNAIPINGSRTFPRRPSITYRKVIENGAREHDFPGDYIQFILSFPDNGWFGQSKVCHQLGYEEYCT